MNKTKLILKEIREGWRKTNVFIDDNLSLIKIIVTHPESKRAVQFAENIVTIINSTTNLPRKNHAVLCPLAFNTIESQKRKIERLERHVTMMLRWKKFPGYGDLMTLEEFIKDCEKGYLTDYDGNGSYATIKRMSNKTVYPSDIKNGYVDKNFSHVIWFNK